MRVLIFIFLVVMNINRFAYFGDSFTATHYSYAVQIFEKTSIPYTNYAVGATRVCGTSYTAEDNKDLIDLYKAELDLGYSGQLVSFAYGRNDVAVRGFVNSQWKKTYQSIINEFIKAGFPKNRLVIMAEPSHSNDARGMRVTRKYAERIARNSGINFYDVHKDFLSYGNSDYFFTEDLVHPNYIGQSIWAEGYLNFLRRRNI